MRLLFLLICLLSCSLTGNETTAPPEALVRRLYLDLFDRLPTESEYLKDRQLIATGKYPQLVDRMLKDKDFQRNISTKIYRHYAPTVERRLPYAEMLIVEHIEKKYARQDFRHFLSDLLTADGIP